MNKGSIVERLCSDLIAKSRDINGLLYFTLLYSSSHVNSLCLFYILLKILEVTMCILFVSSLLRNLSIYNY